MTDCTIALQYISTSTQRHKRLIQCYYYFLNRIQLIQNKVNDNDDDNDHDHDDDHDDVDDDGDDDLLRFLLGLATSRAAQGGSWVLDFYH